MILTEIYECSSWNTMSLVASAAGFSKKLNDSRESWVGRLFVSETRTYTRAWFGSTETHPQSFHLLQVCKCASENAKKGVPMGTILLEWESGSWSSLQRLCFEWVEFESEVRSRLQNVWAFNFWLFLFETYAAFSYPEVEPHACNSICFV